MRFAGKGQRGVLTNISAASSIRKLWRFEFIGEMGIDAGGLAREWFELVSKEIFDPDMGLWQSSITNQMSMTINPASGKYAD